MSKSKRNDPVPIKTYAKANDQPWHGQETRPGAGDSESAEDAASRAEGNAPVPVAQANESPDEAAARSTPAPENPPNPDEQPDSAENAAEKQEAAAEEHAAQPSRRAPHGKL